jgi:anti-sigma regulatory factor (Ser/Thr protein kinase)
LLGSQKNKLEDLNKELEVANSSKDKFFSIIAHDLKLPFNSLINISELLMKQYDEFDSKAIKNFILGINQSSHFAFNLLQNLLSWANSQTNRIEISPTSFDIKLLLEETLSLFSYNAHEKNIELISEIGSDTYVYADVNMVDTVVRNLISNAIKFTNAGGKISLMSKIVNNEVQISISDTGIGIKKVDIEKLFRFDISHSTTGTKMEKGTGLGLILCKEFIEKNNGKIFIESLWGRGSTFSITLPAGNKPLTQESKLPEMKTRIYNELSETLVFEEDKTIENFQNSENYKSNIEYFESNLLKQWNHVRINHFVHEVIEFSVSIREFGLRNKMTSIENYGNELNMYAKSFDIEKMEKNMAIFPDILKKLKK